MKHIEKVKAVSAAKLGATRTGEWISGKVNPLETLQALTKAFEEYARVVETERTKRRQIAADERIAIESLRLKRDLFMEYLARSFDERRSNFEQLFARLDQAIEDGDKATSGSALIAIVDLAKSSPFKGIQSIEELEDSIARKKTIDF